MSPLLGVDVSFIVSRIDLLTVRLDGSPIASCIALSLRTSPLVSLWLPACFLVNAANAASILAGPPRDLMVSDWLVLAWSICSKNFSLLVPNTSNPNDSSRVSFLVLIKSCVGTCAWSASNLSIELSVGSGISAAIPSTVLGWLSSIPNWLYSWSVSLVSTLPLCAGLPLNPALIGMGLALMSVNKRFSIRLSL